MTIESFSFDKGINRKKSRLYLEEGETYSCIGFSFAHDGVLECRTSKTIGNVIDTTVTSIINGIHRYGNNLYASSKALCPGGQAYFNYIYQRDINGAYSNISLLANKVRPKFADYEKFVFIVDGESKKACIDEKEYDWGVENPSAAPIVSATTDAGLPNGTYECYVTFEIQFPNDKYVETGPSPVGTVTSGLFTILWQRIPICQYSGEDLIIHRNLYRTVAGTPYLVTTIADNITTTYTDNIADATLQVASVMSTDDYTTPPDYATDIEIYLQRVFLIKDNRLFWSEPYQPFSFLTSSDAVVTKDYEILVSVIKWGDQLYMVSPVQWYRLSGTDPDAWLIKQTFTDVGIINRDTLKKTKWGLMGLWNDGIYMFDGGMTKDITDKKLGKKFFTDLDDLSVCYAEFDGLKYHFYYASSGSTVDSCIVLDFTYYPELRIYHDNWVASAHELHRDTNTKYLAKSGYEYSDGGTETISTSFVSGDKGFQGILKRKCLDYLYYDIDTGGVDVTVDILADGTSVQTLTLNTSSRIRKRSDKLKAIEGYRFAIQYSCTNSENVKIYSPWALEATPVGE